MAAKNTGLKQKFYIFSFAVLGLLMSLVVYGLISLVILTHNLNINLELYLWIMLVSGVLAGLVEGKRWWRIIYIEKSYLKWPKHKLETKLLGLMVLIVLTVAMLFILNYKM
jgi:hypothetical protein